MKRKFSELSSHIDKLEINNSKKYLKEETVQTYCRIKHNDENDRLYDFKISNDYTKLTIDDNKANIKSFNFTKIFPPLTDNIEIFHTLCQPVIDDMINLQKSALIFTYGLTKSGKTYTIIGDTTNPGILPLSIKYLINSTKTNEAKVLYNCLEIYDDNIYDLLSESGKKKLTIDERDKMFYVNNVTDKKIITLDDFSEDITKAMKKICHTSPNNNSSKIHMLFKIILKMNDNQIVNLSIIDLAGEDRIHNDICNGKHLTQTYDRSLSVLSMCFELMNYNSVHMIKKNIPFDQSKLTMLFHEYFQGDQNVVMILNITLSKDDYEDTRKIFSFASIVKEIRPSKFKLITIKNNIDIDNTKLIKSKRKEINYKENNNVDNCTENKLLRNPNAILNSKYFEELQSEIKSLLISNLEDRNNNEEEFKLINPINNTIEKISEEILYLFKIEITNITNQSKTPENRRESQVSTYKINRNNIHNAESDEESTNTNLRIKKRKDVNNKQSETNSVFTNNYELPKNLSIDNIFWCSVCYTIFFYKKIKDIKKHLNKNCVEFQFMHEGCIRKFNNYQARNRHEVCFKTHPDLLPENDIRNPNFQF